MRPPKERLDSGRPAAKVWATVDRTLTRWFGTAQFTWRGVVSLLVPVIISQAFAIGFFAINPMLVSSSGVDAISAVSTVEYLNVFLLSVFIALATAGSVLVAQFVGRGDRGSVHRAAGAMLWAAAVPAAVIGALLLALQGPLRDALLGGAGGHVAGYGRLYLTGSVVSYPAYALVEASSGALRGIARTRPALYLTIASNGGFLLLASVLVHGFGLGVGGLAISLVVARYSAAGIALLLLRREPAIAAGGRWAWPPDLAMVRRALGISLPFVAENVFFNGGKLLIQFFVVGLGTFQITANAVGASLVSFGDFIPSAMCVALVPIVGQAIGSGRIDDARRVTRSFAFASTAAGSLGSLLTLALFPLLIRAYHVPPEMTGTIVGILLVSSLGRVLGLWSWSFLLPAGLRAAGDTVFTTIVASLAMVGRVVFCWVFGVRLGYGVVGIWSVMVAEWAIRSTVFKLRLRSSRWERRSFVRPAADSRTESRSESPAGSRTHPTTRSRTQPPTSSRTQPPTSSPTRPRAGSRTRPRAGSRTKSATRPRLAKTPALTAFDERRGAVLTPSVEAGRPINSAPRP